MQPKDDLILLSHGGGGMKSKQLIEDLIVKHFRNPILSQFDDSASLTIPENHLAFTTDSYVIDPVFFPGGDIGKLAACGTINDLVMQGAQPKYMSLGLILEEGFSLADLDKILKSLAEVLNATGVTLVTGDTKVVGRGQANGIFINTSGIGIRWEGIDARSSKAQPGDAVILTGTMGDHGIAVMSRRQGLELQSKLESDVAPLWEMLQPLFKDLTTLHCLRDPTRGGVAAALCDIAQASRVGIRIRESELPVKKETQGVCGLLGLDPLHVANEGKALVFCPEADSEKALQIIRGHALGKDAKEIGRVVSEPQGRVILETRIGGERIVEIPSGEELPRIC